jgi:cell wall-associated NlpC family hydrolase
MTPKERTQRDAVVAEALTWEGTAYHHRGRLKGIGTDCAMLPLDVYAAVGLIPRIDPPDYPIDWFLHRSSETYYDVLRQYSHPVTAPQPGDMALFRFGRVQYAHGGILIAPDLMLHAENGVGVVRCNLSGSPIFERLVGYFSIW